MGMKSIKVLVVEDETSHAEAIRRAFTTSGMASDIETVYSLGQYRESVQASLPDVVLLDYKLPDGSAMDVLACPAESGDFPVILMTSHGNEDLAVQAMKSGAIDYVVKTAESLASMPQKIVSVLREWGLLKERKRAQEELQEAKEDWERTFDAVPDLIAILNPDCTIKRINRAMAKRLAKNGVDSALGSTCYSIFHQSDTPVHDCPHQKLLLSGRDEHKEMPAFGGIFEVSVTPLKNASGVTMGAIHLAHDVSERKEAEATRIELERKLQQAQKMEAVGQLAGGVAHDFNNIMQVIAGNAQLLKMGGGVSTAGMRYLQEIESAIERGASLTKGLLAFSRFQVREFTTIDLNRVATESFALAKKLVTEELHFRLEACGGALTVFGDRALLQQVIFNFVTNSRDAVSGHGTIILRTGHRDFTRAALEANGLNLEEGRYAFISASDSGKGMTAEIKDKAFEPFFTTKEVGKGTGLGLAMAYGTARQHNGFIAIDSNPGEGCTVTLYIPLVPESPVAGDPGLKEEILRGEGETILLAEDEESVRQMMKAVLEAAGYRVMATVDGKEAVEMFLRKSAEIDLVILDLVMPNQNGSAALGEIQAKCPDIPYVLLSGYSVDPHDANVPKSRLLNKPVHPLMLLRTIRQLLAASLSARGDHDGTHTAH